MPIDLFGKRKGLQTMLPLDEKVGVANNKDDKIRCGGCHSRIVRWATR